MTRVSPSFGITFTRAATNSDARNIQGCPTTVAPSRLATRVAYQQRQYKSEGSDDDDQKKHKKDTTLVEERFDMEGGAIAQRGDDTIIEETKEAVENIEETLSVIDPKNKPQHPATGLQRMRNDSDTLAHPDPYMDKTTAQQVIDNPRATQKERRRAKQILQDELVEEQNTEAKQLLSA